MTFPALEKMLKNKIGLKTLRKDTLITLDLYSLDFGYTNAGLLFSSENAFPGIEIIRFGKSDNEILTRKTFSNQSVLDQYENVCDFFELFYSVEKIEGMERNKVFQIPQTAFREALANALVHRDWSLNNVSVRLFMYEDRVEILSPGGLPKPGSLPKGVTEDLYLHEYYSVVRNPQIAYVFLRLGLIEKFGTGIARIKPGSLPKGVTEDLYLHEYYSVVRNPQIAYVFLRLGLIEKFGTGIARIMDAYKSEMIKPAFQITPNTIKVTLPLTGQHDTLDNEQRPIYQYLKVHSYASRLEIEKHCGYSRSKTTNLLNRMMSEHIIGRTGNSRSVQYFIL